MSHCLVGQRTAGAASTRRVVPAPRASARSRVVRANSNVGGAAGAEKAFFGEDFGARDPYAAELESNFGEKVLGNWNTDHIIKPPDALGKVIGLAARACADAAPGLLDDSTRERLRQQVPGWRVVTPPGGGAMLIQQEWTVKDAESAQRLVDSIGELAKEQGHAPASVEAVGGTTVVAQLTTGGAGGLTEADFILAAKVNSLDLSPLLPKRKQRFWA